MSTTPIVGYRTQTPEALYTVNQNKALEELVLRQIDAHLRLDSKEIDQRWVAIARTHIQEGFMALNRAVLGPARIEGKLDLGYLTAYLEELR